MLRKKVVDSETDSDDDQKDEFQTFSRAPNKKCVDTKQSNDDINSDEELVIIKIPQDKYISLKKEIEKLKHENAVLKCENNGLKIKEFWFDDISGDAIARAISIWILVDDIQKELNCDFDTCKLDKVKKIASRALINDLISSATDSISIEGGKLSLNKRVVKEKYTISLIRRALSKDYKEEKIKKVVELVENNDDTIDFKTMKEIVTKVFKKNEIDNVMKSIEKNRSNVTKYSIKRVED